MIALYGSVGVRACGAGGWCQCDVRHAIECETEYKPHARIGPNKNRTQAKQNGTHTRARLVHMISTCARAREYGLVCVSA